MNEFPDSIELDLESGPWVVYAGNPDNYQNLDVLMKAMSRIPDVRLLMVSASSLEKWHGHDNVHCVQTSDFQKVCSYIRSADLAVLPRVACSGFPMKLLNYLALGLPTVVAAGSAIDIDGVISVPNYDDSAMAEAIRTLLSDPERRNRMGKAAQKAIQSDYSWDVQCEKLEHIYYNLLDNGL
jgi:glycosyltransferase involved in cell wall biosynthesis